MAAGFRGPLFLLGLSANSTVQAGFRGPLPIPFLGARGTVQAGFRGPLPIPFLGAGLPSINPYEPEGGPSDFALLLQDDDEVIMLVARAFLTLVNRCP